MAKNFNSNYSQSALAVKKSNQFIVFIFGIKNSKLIKAIGQFFYNIGFAAELIFLQIWRVAKEIGLFLGHLLAWVFISLGKQIAALFKSIWADFTAPFKRVSVNLKKTKAIKVKEKESGEKTTAIAQLGYIGSDVKSYASVALSIVRYLLPVVAIVALVFTVDSLLGHRYALVVEMDGEVIGYVSDDVVIEEAVRVVQGRIKASDGKSGQDWKPEGISMKISNTDALTNKSQLINNILAVYAVSSERNDALVPASGLMINGELYAVTTEGEQLEIFLEEMKKPYEDNKDTTEVSFVKNIELEMEEDQYFFASSIIDYDELIQELEKEEKPAVYYNVKEGENLERVASAYGITITQLLARNENFAYVEDEETGSLLAEKSGQLLIQRPQKFLQVKKTIEVSSEEEVPYATEEKPNSKRVEGWSAVTQEGVNGLDMVFDSMVYIDGELVDQIRLPEKTQRILEPVNEVVEYGTQVYKPSIISSSGAGNAGGAYIWPVPDYTAVSRGFTGGSGHRGLDITAPAGTPIIASNGGQVTLAGTWSSYGICVVISHDSSTQTLYAHMTSANVASGDVVGAGQVIGFVGSTGRSTGNHCHFEVMQGGTRVDPYGYVAKP